MANGKTVKEKDAEDLFQTPVTPYRENILEAGFHNIHRLAFLQVELFDLQDKRNITQEGIALRESGIMQKVCDAVNGESKPKFSNDTARKAEAARIEATDAVLGEMKKESARQTREIAVKRAHIDAVQNAISLSRAYLHGGGNSMPEQIIEGGK